LPFGPEIGTERSASPEEPLTSVLPDMNQPSSIGEPSASITAGLFFARVTPSL